MFWICPYISRHRVPLNPLLARCRTSDNPAHYSDAIGYSVRMPPQGFLLPLTRLVWAWY